VVYKERLSKILQCHIIGGNLTDDVRISSDCLVLSDACDGFFVWVAFCWEFNKQYNNPCPSNVAYLCSPPGSKQNEKENKKWIILRNTFYRAVSLCLNYWKDKWMKFLLSLSHIRDHCCTLSIHTCMYCAVLIIYHFWNTDITTPICTELCLCLLYTDRPQGRIVTRQVACVTLLIRNFRLSATIILVLFYDFKYNNISQFLFILSLYIQYVTALHACIYIYVCVC